MKTLMLMVKVIIRKIDLDNFRFEMLDNSLIEEMKDCITGEHSQFQLPQHKESADPQAPGRNKRLHVELPLG